MIKPPFISVIIPTFNGARVIGETLASVRKQTFQNFEVIIVDDGSTDNTANIVRQFCESDPRFTLITQPHGGVSVARNTAILRARGEWIALLDHDDVWFPQKLERQMELSRADPRANFLFTNTFSWDGRRDLKLFYRDHKPLPDGDPARTLIFSNRYCTCSTIVARRELFDRAGRFDPNLDPCEDWDLWLRMAEHGLWARGRREPLVRYRRWPGNMTNHKLKMAEIDVLVLQKNLGATQRPELRPLYQRSLNFARGRHELARARQLLDTSPKKIPAAIWRAWQLHPRRLKWLLWFALVAWPKILGGRASAQIVHRKLIKKW